MMCCAIIKSSEIEYMDDSNPALKTSNRKNTPHHDVGKTLRVEASQVLEEESKYMDLLRCKKAHINENN